MDQEQVVHFPEIQNDAKRLARLFARMENASVTFSYTCDKDND